MISAAHRIGGAAMTCLTAAALTMGGSGSAQAATPATSNAGAASHSHSAQHAHHHGPKHHKHKHHKGHATPPVTTESCFGARNVCLTLPNGYTNTVDVSGTAPHTLTYARVTNSAGDVVLDYGEYSGYMGHCDPNVPGYTWDVLADTPVVAPKLAVRAGQPLHAVKLVYSHDGGVHYSPDEFLASSSFALGTHTGMICGPGQTVYDPATGAFTQIYVPWNSDQMSRADAVAAFDGAKLADAWKMMTTIH